MEGEAEKLVEGVGDFFRRDSVEIATALVGILCVAVLTPVLHRVRRTRGRNIVFHVLFAVASSLALWVVPQRIQSVIFSPGGVVIVGTLLPVYESIVAACSIRAENEVVWLQYWIACMSFSYATEFMDVIADQLPSVAKFWHELQFLFLLWLVLPFTDGAALIYDKGTEPYLSPVAHSIKRKMEGWVSFLLVAVNSGYLWILWFTFMTLPEEARRFVVMTVGTVYPLLASTVAITTDESGDDAYWLTYMVCFRILVVSMHYLEKFVGNIRGFYSLCLVATVYLFLPMFQGAKAIFRNVLVPLSGQYENMLLKDVYITKKQMMRHVPPTMHDQIFGKAAKIFHTTKKQS